jgi:UDP-N-acetylmuramoyl-L-alanyl-D-glutamate--2,6-diaminopimelate ligase
VRLRDLLPEADIDERLSAIDIAGVTADSRQVKPGFLFVAIAGVKADGAQFAIQAAKAGAAAMAGECRPDGLPEDVPFIAVTYARRALALAAAKFYPRQPATIVAVTGTSGKTSVAAFTREIWTALGLPAASVGTVGVVSPKGEVYGSLTTPDPVELHRTLDTLAADGVTHLALEASSHGLDQYRLDGVRIAAGAFTNLSRDHLDYHPSIEAYLEAKLRLFRDLIAPGGTAVIDVDDCYAGQVVDAAKKRGLKIMTVGEGGDDIKLVGGAIDGFAQVVQIAHAAHTYKVKLPLVGGFQVQNAAVAAGLAIATGAEPARVFKALENLTGAKGRLELAGTRNGAPIFIDYAHKPDALAKALAALRPYASGKLIVVFGAGGDRDTGKRPIMGRIAHDNGTKATCC